MKKLAVIFLASSLAGCSLIEKCPCFSIFNKQPQPVQRTYVPPPPVK